MDMSVKTKPAAATHWRQALNPPIYLVSVLPGLLVPALAPTPVGHPLGLALATAAVVLLQHAINLFNDAADWRLGADSEKADSWVRVHAYRPESVVRHGAISLLIGGLLGIGVLWTQQQLWLLGIALPLVGLGYGYNAGPRPLSYTHLGEWVTGICYGPGVFGCLWLVAGLAPDGVMAAGAIGCGALAMALLLSHQPPQIETDQRAGKMSFAVRYGIARTRAVARALFGVFLITVAAALAFSLPSPSALMIAGAAALLVVRSVHRPVNPKVILRSASVYVVLALLISWPGAA